MRKIFCAVLCLFAFGGCSGRDWTAKYYAMKAEGFMRKAADLKTKKVAFKDRVKVYEEACRTFETAYDMEPGVFTYGRIEEALEACWKANDKDREEKFRIFEEEYSKAHPLEYEYGDAGVAMNVGE